MVLLSIINSKRFLSSLAERFIAYKSFKRQHLAVQKRINVVSMSASRYKNNLDWYS